MQSVLLTQREEEVLSLIAQGQTRNEIASTLQIAARTVGAHEGAIYAKLHVCNRAAAVAAYYIARLIEMQAELERAIAERDDARGRLEVHELYLDRLRAKQEYAADGD